LPTAPLKTAPVDIRYLCQDRPGGWIDHIQRLRRFQALAVREVVEASGDVRALQRRFAAGAVRTGS
jgi:hypothetical protein